jgi:hypothetical protein
MFDDPLFMERAGADGVRLRFLYQYGYTLDRNHRKVRSLEHLLTFAQDADIHVYVYVSPLNWEGAKNVVGEDFVEHIAQNVDVVCSVVREHSLPCLDLSRALDSSHFETPVYPGSHLDISGRLFLARALHEVFIRADQRFIQHSPTP